jgi:hypothetical protein
MLHPDIKRHATPIFQYLFGVISKYEYRRILGKEEAKRIWALVADNGYVLANCKLYMYARLVGHSHGLVVSPAKYEIDKEDVRTLQSVDLSSVSTKYKVYSLFDFRNMEAAIFLARDMDTYIGKFISKKLIFLVRSYSQKRSEIEASLKIAGLYALRKQYPFYKSDLHALNICKTAISNAGKGLIEYWTRDKRNALLRENGGFQAVNVQYEVMQGLSVMPEHDDDTRLNIQALAAFADKCPPHQREWVNAAAGIHSKGFSFFLGQDNRDAVETLPYPKYLKLLDSYFGIDQASMISQLRISLA